MPIEFRKVNFEYSPGTPFAYKALTDIDLSFEEGKFTAVIGPTGSGKSTMVQHLNALLLPSSGELTVFDHTIQAGVKPKKLKELRRHVGYVFQFPEYQLFEETILKDVSFGPKNFGLTEQEAAARAKAALKLVGIAPELYERSPLELSGGQKRRVAIAGILAMDPEVLVLDEPTAGLDPIGSKTMMALFDTYNEKRNKTVILVTHNMDQVLEYCDRVVAVKDGKIMCHCTVEEFFNSDELMDEAGITPPYIIQLQKMIAEKGIRLEKRYLKVDELAKAIAGKVKP